MKQGGNMNTVLYTKDLEPITVLNMPVWVQEAIEKAGSGRIAVRAPSETDTDEEMPTMLIEVEKLQTKSGETAKFFVTQDEELALSIAPQWLPGQLAMYQYMQKIIQRQKQLLNRLDP
jgi:hypothetical protein